MQKLPFRSHSLFFPFLHSYFSYICRYFSSIDFYSVGFRICFGWCYCILWQTCHLCCIAIFIPLIRNISFENILMICCLEQLTTSAHNNKTFCGKFVFHFFLNFTLNNNKIENWKWTISWKRWHVSHICGTKQLLWNIFKD